MGVTIKFERRDQIDSRGKIKNWSSVDKFEKAWRNDENGDVMVAVVDEEDYPSLEGKDLHQLNNGDGYGVVFFVKGKAIRVTHPIMLDDYSTKNKSHMEKYAAKKLKRMPLEIDNPVVDEVSEKKYGYWYKKDKSGTITNLTTYRNPLTGKKTIIFPNSDFKNSDNYDVILENSTSSERKEWMRNNPYYPYQKYL